MIPGLLLIALDGADSDLLLRWAQSGDLPTIAKLMRTGLETDLSGPAGFGDAPAWTTVYTGLSPAEHGRYSYRQFEPGRYNKIMTTGDTLAAEPFWVPLSDSGKRIAILDLPKAKAPRSLNGLYLGNWLVHGRDQSTPVSCPPDFADRVLREFGDPPESMCGLVQPALDTAGYRTMVDRLCMSVRMKRDLIMSVLDDGPWDLVAAGFKEAHCIGHHGWSLHDPAHPDYDPAASEAIGDPLLTVYSALDTALADIIDHAGEETTVVVFTPLGMGPHFGGFGMLPEIMEGLGYSGNMPVRLARRLLKYVAGPAKPNSSSSPGDQGTRPGLRNRVKEAFEARRDCLTVDLSEHVSGLRVNLIGREPRGRIQPGIEQRRFLDRLTADLCEVTDPQSGEKLVDRIVPTRDLYEGPYLADLPDLLVFWNMNQKVTMAESPKLRRVSTTGQKRRTGAHVERGVLFAVGPALKQTTANQPVDTRGLAPAISQLLGVERDAGYETALSDLLAGVAE